MGKLAGLTAVKDFFCVPKIARRSPEELTSRAEKLILESRSVKSNDSTLDGHDHDSGSSTIGMDCNVKNLYKDNRMGSWTEKVPPLVKDPPENDQTSRFALIVRKRQSQDTRKKLEIDSIIVQSPLLKKALGTVFDGYPGITTDLDRLEFAEPFQPFVHRFQRFEQATVNEKDVETKQHLALLWDVLETELRSVLQKIKDFRRHGICDYGSLWTLFEPNCLILAHRNGGEQLYRCVRGYMTESSYNLEAHSVDWDGDRFGLATTFTAISPFTGTKPLSKLPVSPIARNPHRTEIEERMLARGKVFEALQGYHYRCYNGVGIQTTRLSSARFDVESRVIIDTAAFNLFNPDNQVKLTPLDAGVNASSEPGQMSFESTKKSRPVMSLTREQLLICNDLVRAYSLKDKKWLSLFVDSLEEITWDEDAFPSLVLPIDTKELILAFADSQVKRQQRFDDVISGKGRGTIMLLSGAPGVGKTLTAESVAEVMRTPLYVLSGGDLGTDPKEIERTLVTTLTMTSKWKAILLLDEADVFLTARSVQDLERNKLVSIFLRILEYYEGFLFLTTNRIEDIDAAFESRIHLSLQYDDLDAKCRYHVWRHFLKTCQTAEGEFSEERLWKLAETKLNGRQIKNVIKPAQLLAVRKGSLLKFEHVDIVMKLKAANAFGKAKVAPAIESEG